MACFRRAPVRAVTLLESPEAAADQQLPAAEHQGAGEVLGQWAAAVRRPQLREALPGLLVELAARGLVVQAPKPEASQPVYLRQVVAPGE